MRAEIRWLWVCLLAGALLWQGGRALAADVSMNGDDKLTETSFNSGTHWTGGLAPTSGNNYYTAGHTLRTPTGANGSNSFAGDLLSLDLTIPTNSIMILKYGVPGGSVRVNNLQLNGGAIHQGIRSSTQKVFGNITVLTNSGFDVQDNTRLLLLYAAITGGSSNTLIVKSGMSPPGGVAVLLGDNSGYKGSWAIAGGTSNAVLQVGNGGTQGSLGGGNVTNNASLVFSRSDSVTVSNLIVGTGAVTAAGPGTLALRGANTYSGGTSNLGGILNFAALNNLGSGGLYLGGGTLQYAPGNSADISARTVTVGSAGGTIDVGTNNVLLANPVGNSGTGGLTKTGTGTLTLGAAVSYTGPTVIAAGKLALGSGGSLANSSSICVSNGASLDVTAASGFGLAAGQVLTGAGTVQGGVSYQGTVLCPGNASGGTLTLNGNVTLSGCYLRYSLNSVIGGSNDLLVVNGSLTFAPSEVFELDFPDGVPITGTYTLCQCSGDLVGSPSYLGTTLNGYQVTFALNTNATPRTVTVSIAGSASGLQIARASNQVVLSWPVAANPNPLGLKSSASLAAGTAWSAATNPATLVSDAWCLTNAVAAAAPGGFYQLMPGRHLYGLAGQGGLGQNVDTTKLAQAYSAGVRARLLEVGWNVLQPTSTTDWNSGNASAFQQRIDAFVATGPDTVLLLDLGMQYPPSWVVNTDPLVDQYGSVLNSSASSPTVNVYWSPTVRQYASNYIRQVFTRLNFRGRLWAVRLGPRGGELMYPCSLASGSCAGGSGPDGGQSFWAFDATAQSQAPQAVQGWKPGLASPNGEARIFYNWYVDNLADTFNYLAAVVGKYFNGYVAPVTPGQGITDTTASQLVAANLVDSGKCCYGTGNYWQRLFPELCASTPNVLFWCSSVGDGSGSNETGTNLNGWSAAHMMSYYAGLARRPIYGENPGRNAYSSGQCGAAANTTMQWDFQTVANNYYLGLMWIREGDLTNSCYASLTNYQTLIQLNP